MTFSPTDRIRHGLAWAGSLFFLVAASLLIVQNLHRAYWAEHNRWFKAQNQDWIYGPLTESTGYDPVHRYGWDFNKYQEAEIRLGPLLDAPRFSIHFQMRFRYLHRLDFRLMGEPNSVDLVLWERNSPGVTKNHVYRVDVERYADRAELAIDGRKIDEVRYSDKLAIYGFLIKSFGCDFTIDSIEVDGHHGSPIVKYRFAFPFTWLWQKLLAAAVLVVLFIGLALLQRVGHPPFPARLNRVLFAATPLWAGMLFPLPMPTDRVLEIMIFVSLAPLLARPLLFLAGSVRKIGPAIFPVLAVILAPALASRGGGHYTPLICLGLGILLLGWLGLALHRAQLDAWRILAPATFPAALGLVLLPALLGAERGLSAALLLTSLLMLLQTCRARRRELPTYAALMLAFALVAVPVAELNARLSAFEPRWRPMNIGKKFQVMDDLMFVPGELFDNRMSFSVGSLQFRDRSPNRLPKPGMFRIITLGGSNTYGDWIDHNAQTFSGALETCLNRDRPAKNIEVLNGGAKGFYLFQILKLLENYILEFHPNLIILYINRNDSGLTSGPYTYRQLWQMKHTGQLDSLTRRLGSEQRPARLPPAWIVAVQDMLRPYRLYNALVKFVTERRQKTLPNIAASLGALQDVNPVSDYTANLREFIAVCRQHGIKLVLADEYDTSWVPGSISKETDIRAAMKAEVEHEHLPFVPINDDFHRRADRESLIFGFDPVHLSYYGHQEVGRIFCEFLEKNRLVLR